MNLSEKRSRKSFANMQPSAAGNCTPCPSDRITFTSRLRPCASAETSARSIQSERNHCIASHCPNPITNEKVWTKGGDIEFIDTDDDLEQVVIYITEAQDRMDRVK